MVLGSQRKIVSSQKEVDQNGEKRLLKGRGTRSALLCHPRKTARFRVQALGCKGEV